MMYRVVVIGSGNVAEALAGAAAAGHFRLMQVVARNEWRGRAVAAVAGAEYASDVCSIADADIYIIAVSDSAVAGVAASLPSLPKGALVAHTAGCVPIDDIPDRFMHRAVIYPFQTFTKDRAIDFSQVPFFIEGSDDEAFAAAEGFAACLSRNVRRADADARRAVHLAGVFACNFVNRLYTEGAGILGRAELPFDVLKPIILETAAKAAASADPATGQTGPAVRGDEATQERHMAMLTGDGFLQEIYSKLSQRIWETSKKI